MASASFVFKRLKLLRDNSILWHPTVPITPPFATSCGEKRKWDLKPKIEVPFPCLAVSCVLLEQQHLLDGEERFTRLQAVRRLSL